MIVIETDCINNLFAYSLIADSQLMRQYRIVDAFAVGQVDYVEFASNRVDFKGVVDILLITVYQPAIWLAAVKVVLGEGLSVTFAALKLKPSAEIGTQQSSLFFFVAIDQNPYFLVDADSRQSASCPFPTAGER